MLLNGKFVDHLVSILYDRGFICIHIFFEIHISPINWLTFSSCLLHPSSLQLVELLTPPSPLSHSRPVMVSSVSHIYWAKLSTFVQLIFQNGISIDDWTNKIYHLKVSHFPALKPGIKHTFSWTFGLF